MLNPFAFRPGQVSFWTTVVYLALLIPLVAINETVPPVASDASSAHYNLTEAWHDLTTLTSQYHPYNSRRNDDVRDWLLLRIGEILDASGVAWASEPSRQKARSQTKKSTLDPVVMIFNDMQANATFLPWNKPRNSGLNGTVAQVTYFEGTNIVVYIRGSEDDYGEWWKRSRISGGGTLVNAHYDSVSTGYGATDNGMGVVTVLQLIKHFTRNQPRHGIVALLNNGEEDGLHGAFAFGQSPLLPFVRTFLNLEGAGAGGRATLFRTTDQEVTAAYAKTRDPFGTVVASDSFGLGVIKSGTDFTVLNGIYGQRGLDLAFFKPRARYHTDQDDVKHTSRASLWHMMSASLHTMEVLSSDTGGAFNGPRSDGSRDKVANGTPSDGVWFDLFGKAFVLFNLRGMFAWSLTIAVTGPLILLSLTWMLVRLDKYYFFTLKVRTYDHPDYETVSIGGWKGFLRFPVALVVAQALTVGAAFLIKEVNPFILYSSPWAVWAMMISLFYFSFWSVTRLFDYFRPSALHRGYVHIWLFFFGWAILVAATVFEDRFHVGAVYIFVLFETGVFLSTFITLCEQFALPKKSVWGLQVREEHTAIDNYRAAPHTPDLISPTPGEILSPAAYDEDHAEVTATEHTPLIAGGVVGAGGGTTFSTTYRRSVSAIANGARKLKASGEKPFKREQPWSGHLPSSLWWIQFLILGPCMIILTAQVALLLSDALQQTGADGSDLLLPYLVISLFTLLLLLPITPFMHRISHHVPVFLLVIFVGTLVYNLAAFPFGSSNRYKAYFQQTVDLDTGSTTIHVRGVEEYIRLMVAELPSAAGKAVSCDSPGWGLDTCTYDGASVPPNVGGQLADGVSPQKAYASLVQINATRLEGNKANIVIDAVNTKSCYLKFTNPVSTLFVNGSSGWDKRTGRFPEGGANLLKLWRRDWNTPWTVTVGWYGESGASGRSFSGTQKQAVEHAHAQGLGRSSGELARRASGLDGHVVCKWDDVNNKGTIPAYDEAMQFGPSWATWTKMADGLVEGWKSFSV